mgnify:CR=1 FL=1
MFVALHALYQRTLAAYGNDEEYMLRESGKADELRAARAALRTARGG